MAHPLATFDLHERDNGNAEVVIHVSESYDIKEELKELGFSWSPGTKTWVLRKSFDDDQTAATDTFIETMTSKLGKLGCEIG